MRLGRMLRDTAAKMAGMIWTGVGGGNHPGFRYRILLPGSNFDYEAAVGDAWLNSGVANAIKFVQRVFPEARLEVRAPDAKGNETPILNHPATELIRRPNNQYSGAHLWKATILSMVVDGNAYWRIVRGAGGVGRPLQLWYVPHYRIAPHYPADGSSFIDYYLYVVDGKRQMIPMEDIIHFRDGIDPRDERLGWSPLKPIMREIYSDNEAATFSGAILRNCGMPGMIFSPKSDDAAMDPDKARLLKDRYRDETTGDNRGGVFVSTLPMEAKTVGLSPEQMTLDKIRNIPELRIAAAVGIPAALLQFQAGLDKSTYSNMKVFREAAYRQCIIPMQRALADELNLQLLPQIGAKVDKFVWDYSDVPELSEDQTERATRATSLYQGGVLKRSEARAMVGEESTPEDDVYIQDVTQPVDGAEVPEGGPINAPGPSRPSPADDDPDDGEEGDEGDG